jgi:hypothetical protein
MPTELPPVWAGWNFKMTSKGTRNEFDGCTKHESTATVKSPCFPYTPRGMGGAVHPAEAFSFVGVVVARMCKMMPGVSKPTAQTRRNSYLLSEIVAWRSHFRALDTELNGCSSVRGKGVSPE